MSDAGYEAVGARIVDAARAWSSDVVLASQVPDHDELALMRPGAVLVSRVEPARRPELVDELTGLGITALAVDTIPRISRAQAMDVLSSQAGLAGYRAVIEGAAALGRPLSGQVTAAGKLPPARVLVIGAGVAGLAAIGTAHSMDATVHGTDVRPEAAEQVESMGAQFVPLSAAQEVSSDAYAKEMTGDQAASAAVVYAREAAEADIVITTAAVPGRRAPLLLDADALAGMRPGAVVVDMAAATGGNTALTVAGTTTTTGTGVIIVGATDLASRLPEQSTQLYAQNLVNLLTLMTPGKDGDLVVDLDDQIVRGIAVCHGGETLWPPPPVTVSAAPAAAARAPREAERAQAAAEAEEAASAARARRTRLASINIFGGFTVTHRMLAMFRRADS